MTKVPQRHADQCRHRDGFREAIKTAIDFVVEQHGPQVTVQMFIDEDRMRGHSLQLYEGFVRT